MIRERSQTNRMQGLTDSEQPELAVSDELAPLPDWSQVGRHILAEAMRRAMERLAARTGKDSTRFESHAKELS
jgi:hypothetical protein